MRCERTTTLHARPASGTFPHEGRPAGPRPVAIGGDRVLRAVLVTDLVGSTAHAAALGDDAWLATLHAHDALVRDELAAHGGREVATTGDGFLTVFEGPCRAIRCARAIATRVRALGLRTRAGIHTGEVERRGHDVCGIAVHIATRVAELAGPDEILVSGVVPQLVLGSELTFQDRGEHTLKGVPGRWRVLAVA